MIKNTIQRIILINTLAFFVIGTVIIAMPANSLAATTQKKSTSKPKSSPKKDPPKPAKNDPPKENPSNGLPRYSVGGNKDQCIANLSKEDLKDIKEKKKSTISKRKGDVKYLKEKYLPTTDKNKQKFLSSKEAIEKQGGIRSALEKARTGGLMGQDPNPSYALQPTPESQVDTSTLHQQIDNAQKLIDQASKLLDQNNAKKADVINAICSAVHDGQVYQTILPNMRMQYFKSRIDTQHLANWKNTAKMLVALDVYEAKKATDSNFDSDNKLGPEVRQEYLKVARMQEDLKNLNDMIIGLNYGANGMFKSTNEKITDQAKVVMSQANGKDSTINPVFDKILKSTAKKTTKPSTGGTPAPKTSKNTTGGAPAPNSH